MQPAKNRRKSEMRIELPPPDLSQFKEPAPPQPDAPRLPGAQQQQQQQQALPPGRQFPPLGKEVLEMHNALKNTTAKVGEIVKYHADMKKLGFSPGQPVPKALVSALNNEVAKFDQYRDVLETQILHSIMILTREANRQKAKVAEAEASRAAAPPPFSPAKLEGESNDLPTADQAGQELAEVAKEDEKMEETATVDSNVQHVQEGDPSTKSQDVSKDETTTDIPHPERRISSTGPTAVSLSVLPQVSPDPSNPQQLPDGGAGQSKQGRRFTLRLDLSASGLRQGLPTDLGMDGGERPASPVTLAPRTAKPRADDPVSAITFTGPELGPMGPFDSSVASYSGHPASSFSSQSSIPLAAVVGNAMSGTNTVPDILSSFTGPMEMPVNAQQLMDFGPPPMPQNTATQPDIIDLTTNSPRIGPTETIDLTMDSPTIPLSQLVGSKNAPAAITFADPFPMAEGEGVGGDGGLGGNNDGQGHQAGGQDTLDGLLSSFVDSSTDLSGPLPQPSSIPSVESSTQPASNLSMDATSMLASLTAAASGQNSQSPALNTQAATDVLEGLDLSLTSMTFPDMNDMGGMSFMSGADDAFSANMEGMDMDVMSTLYDMPSGFGDAVMHRGPSDASDTLQGLGLMGEAGAGSGMDFSDMDAFISDMGDSGQLGGSGGLDASDGTK